MEIPCRRAPWIQPLGLLLLATAYIQAGQTDVAIPWDQIGAKAGADYHGDGLSVMRTAEGAQLRCTFQRMEGKVTREGLWLGSTVTNHGHGHFKVKATAVGRAGSAGKLLPSTGEVDVNAQTVAFTRRGLVEEYSVSIHGVRQDFVVLERPPKDLSVASENEGALRVELAVTGAQVEPTAHGAQLVLESSGRKVAYSRLKVTDAAGKELPARMEVSESKFHNPKSGASLAIVVEDAGAVYPVRIDPTFSDANWISMGGMPGTDNNSVRAVLVDDLGHLYIGGYFTIAGSVVANGVARWDGSSWSGLGLGMNSSGGVNALAKLGNDIYAGGTFLLATNNGGAAVNVRGLAKWDGSNWSTVGWGLFGVVNALAVSGGDLYVGGNFVRVTNSGGAAVTANGIARWNGTTWNALGEGVNASVNALAVSGGDVYAGGTFRTATNGGGAAVTVNRIAKWNGSAWSALGLGVNNTVNALAVSGSDVYVGGLFTSVTNTGGAGVAAIRIARWNGSSWSALGLGLSDPVQALAVSGSDLYAGGEFDGTLNYIARWNGSAWSAVGAGLNSTVYALTVSGSNLYVGGAFTFAVGSGPAHKIAGWNGSAWSTFGSGWNSAVTAWALLSGDLYAGGYFTMTPNCPASRIAKWNGTSWSPVGLGLNGAVEALATSGTHLYVGGSFTTATNSGGAAVTVNRVARWDGSSWHALGSGVNSDIFALAVMGSNVYAGGSFWMAGGNEIENIAQWNGSTWSAVGDGVNDWVFALAVSGTNLYAGGAFTTAGEFSANHVARWNGSAWSDLDFGVSSWVYALAVSGSNLYVGGEFSRAGELDLRVNSIARWNGTSWNALGTGMDDVVYALAVSGADLYAGGEFYMAGGGDANSIARWDGGSWSALGSGITEPRFGGGVLALLATTSDLYVGGEFSMAGDKVSAFVARASLSVPLRFSTTGGFTNSQFRLSLTGPEGASAVISASTNLHTWTPLITNPLTGGSMNFTDTQSTNYPRRFYRATIVP